jgi:hypothetical protein
MTEEAATKRVTLADLVTDGIVRAGTRVSATHKGQLFAATVTEDGKLRLPGGYEGSPSSAATQCTGTSLNGWTFWRIEGKHLDSLRPSR